MGGGGGGMTPSSPTALSTNSNNVKVFEEFRTALLWRSQWNQTAKTAMCMLDHFFLLRQHCYRGATVGMLWQCRSCESVGFNFQGGHAYGHGVKLVNCSLFFIESIWILSWKAIFNSERHLFCLVGASCEERHCCSQPRDDFWRSHFAERKHDILEEITWGRSLNRAHRILVFLHDWTSITKSHTPTLSISLLRWCLSLPSVSTLYWWGPIVWKSQAVYSSKTVYKNILTLQWVYAHPIV